MNREPDDRLRSGPYLIEVLREEGPEGNDLFVARLKVMPSCLGQGATVEEAVRNLEAVTEAYIQARRRRGEAVPPADIEAVEIVRIVHLVIGDAFAEGGAWGRPDPFVLSTPLSDCARITSPDVILA